MADACEVGGFRPQAWALAREGLGFVTDRETATWVILATLDLRRRESEDPMALGIVTDSPERLHIYAVADRCSFTPSTDLFPYRRFPYLDRAAVLTSGRPGFLCFWAGEFERVLPLFRDLALEAERTGLIETAVFNWATRSRANAALGRLKEADEDARRGHELETRLPATSNAVIQLWGADWLRRETRGLSTDDAREMLNGFTRMVTQAEHGWLHALGRAEIAQNQARIGRSEEAIRSLDLLLPALQRAPAYAGNYPVVACVAVSTLWLLGRSDYATVLERCLREKVLTPDFRYDTVDSRHALAQLCSLQGRLDEARQWFAEARTVLDEQGARPLRAICDYDEALALIRDQESGIRDQAFPVERRAEVEALLGAALDQFREIGMTGWIRRAEALLAGRTGP